MTRKVETSIITNQIGGSGAMEAETKDFDGVELVPSRIAEVVELLVAAEIPKELEEVELDGLTRVEVGNFWLAVVSICHQTSPLGLPPLKGFVDGRDLRGWDFLVASFRKAVAVTPGLLSPSSWSQIQTRWVVDVFGNEISDPAGRARLLRNLGDEMQRHHWSWFEQLFEISEGRLATRDSGLLALLRTFEAYTDPVEKKSYFLLSLMRSSCGWDYKDPQNLGPPVDYHEVRGHLRVGTVRIRDFNLQQNVSNGRMISKAADINIRKAVREAILQISEQTRINDPSVLHYLFWNVFRAQCTRLHPNCIGDRPSTLPVRYRNLNDQVPSNACPLLMACAAFESKHFPIMEYSCDTEYY